MMKKEDIEKRIDEIHGEKLEHESEIRKLQEEEAILLSELED
jgi:hypothetical protein